MPMRWGIAAFYVAAAVLTGYAALYQMLQTINGAPWSWWYLIRLGASILLLVGGIKAVAPRVKSGWLVAISAAIPLAFCALFGSLPPRCWIFAFVVAVVALATLLIGSAMNRHGFAAFTASLLLVLSWLPASIATLRDYFAGNAPSTSPVALLPLLVLWVFIIGASVLSGIVSLRSSQA